jgi:hypothetical protein
VVEKVEYNLSSLKQLKKPPVRRFFIVNSFSVRIRKDSLKRVSDQVQVGFSRINAFVLYWIIHNKDALTEPGYM